MKISFRCGESRVIRFIQKEGIRIDDVSPDFIKNTYMFYNRESSYTFLLVFKGSYFRIFSQYIQEIIYFFNKISGYSLTPLPVQICKDCIKLFVCSFRPFNL